MAAGLSVVLALGFAVLVLPTITAERWLTAAGSGLVEVGKPAPFTVRVPSFYGFSRAGAHLGAGGIVIARGEVATAAAAAEARQVKATLFGGGLPYGVLGGILFVFALIFSHHVRRSQRGRLVRVQVVSLGAVAILAIVVKITLLTTAVSVLALPLALFALVPTLVLDRIVGLATGVLAALVVSLLAPFDVGIAILLLVQVAAAGLIVPERPRLRWRSAAAAGGIATVLTVATWVFVTYLTTGGVPPLTDAMTSPWLAAAAGPLVAGLLAAPLVPLYEQLVGEITQGHLIQLEDLSNPMLKQIASKSPGTWQHSLMMANMAEIAANAIGASGRLTRVGAYYHDLGKSLQPKYFIENLEPGETSPHDSLPPEVSCDAILAHVTEGIVAARRAGLHERIIDFMHMHHGDGVLEYFWAKCKEQGNPNELTIDAFRYPGHPPQSRETAILTICDAVEAASRTLKRPDPKAIDALVQRIVYGKLHLGQLDESGLSMRDLRAISDSLRETIRHANHGRIEYPWQKAQQDASASAPAATTTAPRLDSLDVTPPPVAYTTAPVASGSTATDETTNLKRDVAMLDTAPLESAALPQAMPAATIVEEDSATVDLQPPSASASLPLLSDAELGVRASDPALEQQPSAPRTLSTFTATASAPEVSAEEALRARLEDRVTHPPAISRVPSSGARKRAATLAPAAAPRAPALAALAARRAAVLIEEQPAVAESPFDPDFDTSVTDPKLPQVDEAGRLTRQRVADLPLRAPASNPEITLPGADQQFKDREVTRRQTVDEVELLHRRAQQQAEVDASTTRRMAMPTAEVDPDDIESAIELAPPARRAPTAIAIAKPKQPK